MILHGYSIGDTIDHLLSFDNFNVLVIHLLLIVPTHLQPIILTHLQIFSIYYLFSHPQNISGFKS